MHGIVGASGALGRRVTARLRTRGNRLRLFSRQPASLEDLADDRTEIVQADLRDTAWEAGRLEGLDTLILCAHGMVPPARSNNPLLTDDRGQRRVIDAAQSAGVRRIVFVSAAGADANAATLFMRIKGRVEEHLARSGCDYRIVRPTVFIETHAILLLAEPLRASAKVRMFGSGRTPINWIATGDVAEYVVARAVSREREAAVATVGGPDTLSRIEVLERIEARLGRTAARQHAPLPLLRLIAATAGRINPALACLIGLAIEEERQHTSAAPAPLHLDWVGPTAVDDVLARWHAESATVSG